MLIYYLARTKFLAGILQMKRNNNIHIYIHGINKSRPHKGKYYSSVFEFTNSVYS